MHFMTGQKLIHKAPPNTHHGEIVRGLNVAEVEAIEHFEGVLLVLI